MTDSSVIAFGIAAIVGAFLTIRFTFIRSKILELQRNAKDLVDKKYSDFEALVYSKRRDDRDPQQGLNMAALYFKAMEIQNGLFNFYKRNKRHEWIDISAIILLILAGIINYSSISFQINPAIDAIIGIHLVATFYLVSFSFSFFIQSLRQINKVESQLGIGQPKPTL